MLKQFVIMLNYAPVKNESYYAQKYASIMCRGLLYTSSYTMHTIYMYMYMLCTCLVYNARCTSNYFQENGTVSIQRPSSSSPEAVGFLRALMIPVSISLLPSQLGAEKTPLQWPGYKAYTCMLYEVRTLLLPQSAIFSLKPGHLIIQVSLKCNVL